jgi:hypothetical protein
MWSRNCLKRSDSSAAARFGVSDRVHRLLQLLERPHLDLADALAADAVLRMRSTVFGREVFQRRRFILQAALGG